METKTVAIVGSSGLIGNILLSILQTDDSYSEIRILVRKDPNIQHPKVKTIIVDFTNSHEIDTALKNCDAVFCAIGTTQKKVKGNKIEYRKVDHDIPVTIAKSCIEIGCRCFAIVSSLGADSTSKNFYLQLKGEVEDEISIMNFQKLIIVRPSLLLGYRNEFRIGELFAKWIMIPLSYILPSKMRAIKAQTVALAMKKAIEQNITGKKILHYSEMQRIVRY